MSTKNEQRGTDVRQKNVYQKPLHQHSSTRSSPSSLPAFIKPGFCSGSNPIAALLTDSFLDFSARQGTDLRSQGIGPGQRYCVEAARWKEAVDSGVEEVPRVKLDCTHVSALDTVGLGELKRFAAEGDNDFVEWPGSRTGASIRESGEIGGKEPRA